jgi:gliding motility-associated-like protein
VRDNNGCGDTHPLIITEPDDWRIDLPADTTLNYGQAFILKAEISGSPAGLPAIAWSDGQCPDCLTRTLALTEQTYLEVVATDDNGCVHDDAIRLIVRIDRNLYIPNVFSPDGDGINDRFLISADPTIDLIEYLLIFDRWGNAVFHATDFLPNDPAAAWDGTFNGDRMQPAVFAYRVAVRYVDGRRGVFFGDVTLLR